MDGEVVEEVVKVFKVHPDGEFWQAIVLEYVRQGVEMSWAIKCANCAVQALRK
jgi:hypothetical protein